MGVVAANAFLDRFKDQDAVRHCFDAFFYCWAMMEHYIASKLIVFEHVAFPGDYYLKAINRNRPVFDAFLREYRLTRSASFLHRLDVAAAEPTRVPAH